MNRKTMTTYLFEANYAGDEIKGLMREGPDDQFVRQRQRAAEAATDAGRDRRSFSKDAVVPGSRAI